MAIAEVCRNLVCAGAEPIGITDCLNFASPEDPGTMDQLARAIDGLAEACRALDVPVVSGNVSLYNETADASGRKPILPTPTVAAVGLVREPEDIVTQWFASGGETILLLGVASEAGLGGSEYQAMKTGALGGPAPRIDLDAEKRLQKLVLELARAHVLSSAHDVSDGGLAVALAECCTTGPNLVGADVEVPVGASATAALFGEAPSRVVVTVAATAEAEVTRRAGEAGVPLQKLGRTGKDGRLTLRAGGHALDLATADLRDARQSCLSKIVGESSQ
jgi:phosphoribosylformylglycinamidine synthase